MDSVTIKIDGLAELEKKLEQMGNDLAAKSIVSAAYGVNKTVVDQARANIAANGLVDTGLLQKSISRKRIVYGKDGRVLIITGVSKSVKGTDRRGKPRVPWRYANVLEPKYDFMKAAQATTKDTVVNSFVDNLHNRIKKYLTKQ